MARKKCKNRAEQQNAYRERVRERTRIQDAYEWTDNWDIRYPEQAAEVRDFIRQIQRKVAEEIGQGHHPAKEKIEYVVDYVVRTLFAFRKGTPVWVCPVSNGIIVAGSHFPDVIGIELVVETHKQNLEVSPTYSALYRELLLILDSRFGNNNDRDSEAIKQELAGTFVLPVQQPEPPKPLPSLEEVLAQA